MKNINENKFYQALENIFTGANIEGEGGYVNLLKIKSKYYSLILKEFKKQVDEEPIIDDSFKEEFFDKLYTFFERYFSESGSVYFVKTANYQRIYEQVYTDNKDVALFWKTHMLYYVKSDILFRSIDVEITDDNGIKYNFFFDVGKLQAKKNNEKRQLVFTFREVKEKKFVFDVTYSENGKKTKIDDIQRQIKKVSDIVPSEDVLKKAFNTFKKQSEVDFFINKNAEKFLTEQLDLFLHQILLNEENKFDQKRLDQLKTIKTFALKIIKFIAQFEDELVRVWNKPKFALNSNYVITLDKLNKDILDKIAKHKNLNEQIKEWQELGMVDDDFKFEQVFEKDNDGKLKFKEDKTLLNKKWQYLPVDTKYFKDLELDILSLFDNLDEALDGRLIHSENYQVLNTLKEKYKEKVQCVYIDPPFNTGSDFVFIDKYQDSSWLTLMNNRIKLARDFLREDGSFYLHLDHIAEHYGKILLDNILGKENFQAKITWNTGDNISGFKSQALNWIRQADFIHFYTKTNNYNFYKTYEVLQTNNSNIGWLDFIKDENGFYIEKYNETNILSKLYFNDIKLKAKGTIWNDIYSFQYSEPRITESIGFISNQKPENLLRRIIQSATKKSDLVLDFFAGSGTTLSVAQKLNRRWIGIELGEFFNDFYIDEIKIKKEQFDNINKEAILEILKETEKEITLKVKKLGLLGRLKNVLNGDSEFHSIYSNQLRNPHLTKDINWQGGGFFKYYSLEQYEDTLRNMKYADYESDDLFSAGKRIFEEYIFYSDEKFAHILEIKKDNVLEIDFDKLYKNIDFPETISNILGLSIKRITKDTVILQDGEEERPIKYDYKNMSEEEKLEFLKILKPLLWWGK